MPDDDAPRTHLSELPLDPFLLFADWQRRAEAADEIQYPTAMCLSTTGADGWPRGRFVIAHFVDRAFVFLTDCRSPKARALAANPRAALTVYWGRPLELQVRIEGRVEEATEATADAIFARRPKPSQTTPWASRQSEVTDFEALEERLRELDERWAERESLPRPEHWRGYRLSPSRFEFWAARARRLHDRFEYRLRSGASWTRDRLAP